MCPTGMITSLEGTRSKSNCFSCPPGQYGRVDVEGGFGECQDCDPGTASTSSGAVISCERCPPGTFSGLGQIACTKCPRGTFSQRHKTRFRCRPCPPGMYQDMEGGVECKTCPNGSVSVDTRDACAAVCIAGAMGCISCGPGTGYDALRGICVQCENGLFNPGRLSTGCQKCPKGRGEVPNEKRDACVCPDGTSLSTGRFKTCQPCNSKEDFVDGMCQCKEQFYASPSGTCECPPKTKLEGENCVPCSEREVKGHSTNLCVVCANDQYLNTSENRCRTCPAGTTNTVPNGTSCEKCNNTYIENGKTMCGCSKGTEEQGGTCVTCDVTQVKDGVTYCGCAPGYRTLFPNEKACLPCPKGTAGGGEGVCQDCKFGFFADVAGLTKCKRCPPGRDYLQEYGQKSCPYPLCDKDSSKPLRRCACGKNEVNDGTAERPVCRECKGKRAYMSGGKCVCPIGSFWEAGECLRCPRGMFNNRLNARACRLCPQGYFADTIGNFECQPCPEGFVAPAKGSRKCTPCRRGFEAPGEKCVSCKAGERVRNRSCVSCIDSVSNGGGVAFCRKCRKGLRPNGDNSKCIKQ